VRVRGGEIASLGCEETDCGVLCVDALFVIEKNLSIVSEIAKQLRRKCVMRA